jgi:ribonuclease HI
MPKIRLLAGKVKHVDIMQYKPFLNCGLMPENKNVWAAAWELARSIDNVTNERDSTQYRHFERWEEGYRRAASDGSCTDPDDYRLARAGYGIYYGKDHPMNKAKPLYGERVQNSYVAELRALVEVCEEADVPTWITLDNEAVVKQAQTMMDWNRMHHQELQGKAQDKSNTSLGQTILLYTKKQAEILQMHLDKRALR